MLQEKEIGKIHKKKLKLYQRKTEKDSKDSEGISNGGKDGKNKKCKYCGRIHKPKMCPAYGQECRKCKKKNHWAICCQSKSVNEAKQYVIETITEHEATNIDTCEATAIIKIEESDIRVKLDIGAELNVMLKRVYDQLKKSNKKLKKKHQLSCMVMESIIFQLLAQQGLNGVLTMFENQQISMWYKQKA